MDVQQLRVLVSVVEEGSFTAAARRLHLTQSGVSRAISNLESGVGLALLERSRSGVWPTELGQRVLGHARAVLSSFEAIEQEASAFSGLETGSVKVGAFPSVCSTLLPNVIAEFEAYYTGVGVELSEGWSAEVLGWVQDRGIDVGFVGLPLQDAEARRMESFPVVRDRMVAVVSREHPLAASSEVGALYRLENEPFILPRGHHEGIISEILENAGIRPKVRFRVRDANSILAAVGHGLGWSVVNEMSIPTTATGIHYAPVIPAVEHEVGMAVRASLQTPPAVDAFIQFVKNKPSSGDGATSI